MTEEWRELARERFVKYAKKGLELRGVGGPNTADLIESLADGLLAALDVVTIDLEISDADSDEVES